MHPFLFAYWWLVDNNLWRDVINWGIAAILGFFLGRVPWRKHQKRRAAEAGELLDRLNAHTPGGLGDIAALLAQREGSE